MIALHLSPGFSPGPYKAIDYESFIFNGGEPHIELKLTVA